MSWLLFLDECGHDHRIVPYEVRGGVALHASQLWAFVQEMQRLEVDCFGDRLDRFGREIKGRKLLDRDRLRWAGQAGLLADASRRRHARAFLEKGLRREPRTRSEFTAYGQACQLMATGIFQTLRNRKAVLFASAIPKDAPRPAMWQADEFLRKDQVVLLERYFCFLQGKQEHGLLVVDQIEAAADRRLARRLETYFTRTDTGRHRTAWIVPTPLFVSSDMTYAVQAADVCIYCINWGFRLPRDGMNAPGRPEIADKFGPWISQLEFHAEACEEGRVRTLRGVTFIPDPYTPR